MTNRDTKPTAEQLFVERLSALQDGDAMTDAEVDALAKESGVDLAASLAAALQKVQAAKTRALREALASAQSGRAAALAKLKSIRATRTRTENLAFINAMASRMPAQQQALTFHRNFAAATDEDVASLAAEMALLVGADDSE